MPTGLSQASLHCRACAESGSRYDNDPALRAYHALSLSQGREREQMGVVAWIQGREVSEPCLASLRPRSSAAVSCRSTTQFSPGSSPQTSLALRAWAGARSNISDCHGTADASLFRAEWKDQAEAGAPGCQVVSFGFGKPCFESWHTRLLGTPHAPQKSASCLKTGARLLKQYVSCTPPGSKNERKCASLHHCLLKLHASKRGCELTRSPKLQTGQTWAPSLHCTDTFHSEIALEAFGNWATIYPCNLDNR